jgi:hypothetical protein
VLHEEDEVSDWLEQRLEKIPKRLLARPRNARGPWDMPDEMLKEKT